MAWAARAGRKAVPIMTSLVMSARPLRSGQGPTGRSAGLVASVVIAVFSPRRPTAWPRRLGLIVAIVGVHSPGTLVVSFLPMLCIAYAFRELNKADPDCGITFTWAARAFGPRTGWMGGGGSSRPTSS